MNNLSGFEMIAGPRVGSVLAALGFLTIGDEFREVFDFKRAGDDREENGCFEMRIETFNTRRDILARSVGNRGRGGGRSGVTPGDIGTPVCGGVE